MAIKNTDRYSVTRKYLEARSSAFRIDPARFKKFLDVNNMETYGVVTDLPVSRRVSATLSAYINGAANMYFNHGIEYVGAASRYIEVAKAAQLLIAQGDIIKKNAIKVTSYDLPAGLDYNAYILTTGGIYKITYRPSELKDDDKEMRLFDVCCRNLMRELHDAQVKDSTLKK